MNTLLRWWLLFCCTTFGLVTIGFFNFYSYLWAVDPTRLGFITLGLFLVVTIFIGMLTYHARHGDQLFAMHLPLCWYMTELMMGLGMMGTLVGFLLLLQAAFGGQINLADAVGTQKMLSSMAVGFATAGVTTLVGLGSSLLTKLQLVNLEYLLEEEA